MDTEWFCVDAHGRVARFDTGEDGALPNAAAVGLSPGDASFDVELLEITRLANVLGRGRDPRPVAANGSAFALTAGRQVIVVDDAALARELIGTGELLIVRGDAPTVLLTRDDVDVDACVFEVEPAESAMPNSAFLGSGSWPWLATAGASFSRAPFLDACYPQYETVADDHRFDPQPWPDGSSRLEPPSRVRASSQPNQAA